MARATSAGLYGSKPPVDEARMPAKRAPRAYGLRSESSPTGWYSAGARPSKPRPSRPKSGPVTSNRKPVDPAVVAELARLERIRLAEEAEDIAREQALEARREAWRQANRIGDVDS